jgi:aminopeptidase N
MNSSIKVLENFGLIICDEDFMLLDDENYTYEEKIATAYLISHEVAHQVKLL